MFEKSKSLKRVRGVILSDSGWQRLQTAKQQSELKNNAGQAYTLEEIIDRTGLSHNTLNKVHNQRGAVDRHTLEVYFNAFGLALQPSDFIRSIPHQLNIRHTLKESSLNLLGPVPLNSRFYVSRLPIEQRCYEAVLEPGGLIRIKAPCYMGKTSLMIRLLNQARNRGLYTLPLSLQLADASAFKDLDCFLHWFCRIVTRGLGQPDRLDDYWDDLFGSNYSCTHYFEKYLLNNIDNPIVLALDDVDLVFHYPEIATHFLGLLRAWYERARYGDGSSGLWQKLRLVVVHSTEVYIPLSVNQSPFNVGLSIELPEFTREQVLFLAQQYNLDWQTGQAERLTQVVSGNPYLVQLALNRIAQNEITLDELVATAIDPNGVFGDHLQRQLNYLQQYPDLLAALIQVMTSSTPVELEPVQAFKLQSIGLVRVKQNQVTPRCQLYKQYFQSIVPCLERLWRSEVEERF
jgi:hypothetical protein